MTLCHVVWDWNGTLLADTALTVRAANAALAAAGLADVAGEVTVARWREVADRPISVTYDALVGRALEPDEWRTVVRAWVDCYRQGIAAVGLADGAMDALAAVAGHGWTQSIVSLHEEPVLRADVAAKGIADRFLDIVGARPEGWLGDRKTTMLAAHLAAHGLDPAATVVIGDMVDDATAAQCAGTRVVLVPTGDSSAERLRASGHAVADGLLEAVAGLA
jgi:phosphoglycolate phosphatase-like HAD superfamily hydrolase